MERSEGEIFEISEKTVKRVVLRRRVGKGVIQCALNITKEVFGGSHMEIRGIPVQLTEFVGDPTDVWASPDSEMHDRRSHGAVQRGVCRGFGFSTKVEIGGALVAGRFDWVAVLHFELCKKFSSVGALRDSNGTAGVRTVYVEAEKLGRSAEIANGVVLVEFGDNPIDFTLFFRRDKSIIDVCSDRNSFVSGEEDTFISFRGDESKVH